jgi:serine/threonine protein phosphatase PrpC
MEGMSSFAQRAPMISPRNGQEAVVPSGDLRANAGEESVDDSPCPDIVGKKKTQPFEPKYVDVTKYITPHFTPDTIIDGWENDFLTLRGASVRGGSHRWENTPRQDGFATAFIPEKNWVVVAVADGVSGAPQSHIGASVAVDSAINYFINTKAAGIEQLNWKHVCEIIARNLKLTSKSMKSHGHTLGAVGETENDIAEAALKYLATTFVCAVITKDQSGDGLTAQVISVGDSGTWLLSDDKFHTVAGGKDDGAEITSNDVTPLPYVPDVVDPVDVHVKPGEVLLLGTDGFGEPLGSGDGDLGSLFKTELKTIPSPIAFANTLDFTRKYFVDDRTLVAIWPR